MSTASSGPRNSSTQHGPRAAGPRTDSAPRGRGDDALLPPGAAGATAPPSGTRLPGHDTLLPPGAAGATAPPSGTRLPGHDTLLPPGAAGATAPPSGTRLPGHDTLLPPGAAGATAPPSGTRLPGHDTLLPPGAAGATAPPSGTRLPGHDTLLPPGAAGSRTTGARRTLTPGVGDRPATSEAELPAQAGQLQEHATGLLRQGDELTYWLRKAQAPDQAAQAESRLREALPIALNAIDLSMAALEQLPGGRGVSAYQRVRWIDALTAVQRFSWESLLTDQRRDQDIGAVCAASDVRSRLDQLAELAGQGTVADQARAQLLELRAQVVAAQDQIGEPLPIPWLTGVLAAVARIVKVIAVGLLAAAATAAAQGGEIASQLLVAAVGLAVSAVSEEATRAARSWWDSPTVATRLDGVHHELLHAVDDLGCFLRRLEPGTSPTKDDLLLVRKTQFVALADTYQAKGLVMALDWPAAPEYAARLDRVSNLLGQISSAIDKRKQPLVLAASLGNMAQELARFSIPPDARIHHLAPESLRGRGDHPRTDGRATLEPARQVPGEPEILSSRC